VPPIDAPVTDAGGAADDVELGCVGAETLLSPHAVVTAAAARAAAMTTLQVRMFLLVNGVTFIVIRSVSQRAHAWPTGLWPVVATLMPLV
jgi:hypothetical protein